MNKLHQYPGDELEVFELATNWKKYFGKKILPFLGKNILEVGAGIGATTKILNDGSAYSWTMLEPDNIMYQRLIQKKSLYPDNTSVLHGSISDLSIQQFDTILYVDVLEHIENDKKELASISRHLSNGGHLIVLSPAFNFLYSKFDKAIGHYKRYNKNDLKSISPDSLNLVFIQYLDSLGFFASLVNKFFLHQSYPKKKQIEFWDKKLVPVSKIIDPFFFHSFGKTIIAIWQKA